MKQKTIEEVMGQKMLDKIHKEVFVEPDKLNKKQISIFLRQSMIDELDSKVKKLNCYSDKNINRNSLIELAIEVLVENVDIAIKDYKNTYKKKDVDNFNTVVVPSDSTGLDTFIGEKKWYYMRLSEDKISQLDYIALYIGSPISKITHYGKIKAIKARMHNGKKRYIAYLDGNPIELKKHIPLGDSSPLATRSPKYTTLKKLKTAKDFSDLNID